MEVQNEYGQVVGVAVEGLPAREVVPVTLTGRTCRLEPLGEQHVEGLYVALCRDSPPPVWTYMSDGPFDSPPELAGYVDDLLGRPATVPLVVVLPDGLPAGVACYLRTDPANGVTEIGSITLADRLQRTTASTEAMHLMAAHAFDDLGYRRLEWKCDALNQPSRQAALRLGFTFEGVFRQAVVYKGRNRDTAWFSITDLEWPAIRAVHQRWLDPGNFDEHGQQRARLDTTGHLEEQ